MEPIIRIEHLTHTYSAGTPFQRSAVEDVSLDIMPGEFLGIIGHTGSGKSTLMQQLNGLLKPTSGRVLLAGLPESVPGSTINRLCGSSLDAIGVAARAIKSGETQLMIAGGVESMSRAPFVMGKAESAFSRSMQMEDTTIGWRFINPQMKALYGVHSMPETAENVADEFAISRADQDAFALRSQLRTAAAQEAGRFADELIAVQVPQRKGEPLLFSRDEHPRSTSLEALAKLRGVVRADGSVTAGNASGVNDGACALLLASETALSANDLQPLARVVGVATAGVPILATEYIEGYIPWDGESGCFVLRVRGDSMIGAGILDGDKVVVRPQPDAENGQIVVALLDDSATVKRLKKTGRDVWLMPENPSYAPIPGNEAKILGRGKARIREY